MPLNRPVLLLLHASSEPCIYQIKKSTRTSEINVVSIGYTGNDNNNNKMVREPNVSPHKQIIKDDDVKECISIE